MADPFACSVIDVPVGGADSHPLEVDSHVGPEVQEAFALAGETADNPEKLTMQTSTTLALLQICIEVLQNVIEGVVIVLVPAGDGPVGDLDQPVAVVPGVVSVMEVSLLVSVPQESLSMNRAVRLPLAS